MEPRPHERGKLSDDGNVYFKTTELQWSHVLTNVESFNCCVASVRNAVASMEPRPHERGKRKSPPTTNPFDRASMEPRPHERGKYAGGRRTTHRADRFNGATSSRTWKDWRFFYARCSSPSFNGATSSRTWKERSARANAEGRSGFNGATSSRTWKARQTTHSGQQPPASMEPRPHERGKV